VLQKKKSIPKHKKPSAYYGLHLCHSNSFCLAFNSPFKFWRMIVSVSLITGEEDIVMIFARMSEMMIFLLKSSLLCALKDDSNSLFLLYNSISWSSIFVISAWVVEIDLDVSSSKDLEFFSCTSSFSMSQACCTDVIIGDS
jgi:hypothetical protein